MLEVPPETPPDRPREEYPVCQGMEPSPAARQSYIGLTCSVCGTRIQATEDQLGQQIACPDCDTPVIVSRPVPTEVEKTRPPDPIELYPLAEEVDESSGGARAADLAYVRIACPVCSTLLYATEDQVGRQIVCPDCRVPTVVRRPAEPAAKGHPPGMTAGVDEEYAVREGVDQPPPDSAAYRSYIAVVCPLCHTWLHATEDQVGQELVCPDCDRPMIVPPPPPPKHKPDPMEDAGEGYTVAEAAEVSECAALIAPRRWRFPLGIGRSDDCDFGRSGAARSPPEPPRRPFLSGVFDFPLHLGVCQRWVTLSIGAAMLMLPGVSIVLFMANADPSLSTIHMWVGGLVLAIVACRIALIWISVASGCCLAVLCDTAVGNDRIESWPESVFLDWNTDCFYLINSLLLSAVTGLGIAWGLQCAGVESPVIVPLSLLVLFPVALLSMLEANSPIKPLSRLVWRSMSAAWWAWARFYVGSTILVVAAGWPTLGLLIWSPLLGTIVAAPLLVATLLIYFRLLGRLALCCANATNRVAQPPMAPEDEEDEGDEEEN